MIAALHAKRNRLYLHTIIFVLLVSLVSLAISATCTMPMPLALATMPDHMPGCSDTGMAGNANHQDDASEAMQDCTLEPCLDSQAGSVTDLYRLIKLDLPIFILVFICTFLCLFTSYPPTKVPRKKTEPPVGRRILLIYLFCTLLN